VLRVGVDDDRDAADSFVAGLGPFGYRVDVAYGGAEATEAAIEDQQEVGDRPPLCVKAPRPGRRGSLTSTASRASVNCAGSSRNPSQADECPIRAACRSAR
jgi:hypothetical protein